MHDQPPDATEAPPPIRFSLRRILGLMTLAAVLLGAGGSLLVLTFGPAIAVLIGLFALQLPLMLAVRWLLSK